MVISIGEGLKTAVSARVYCVHSKSTGPVSSTLHQIRRYVSDFLRFFPGKRKCTASEGSSRFDNFRERNFYDMVTKLL